VGTEEISHVELIGTIISRLLDGSAGYTGKKTDRRAGRQGRDTAENRVRYQQHSPLLVGAQGALPVDAAD
jgi:manganese catalase